jgi:hypothetical protein
METCPLPATAATALNSGSNTLVLVAKRLQGAHALARCTAHVRPGARDQVSHLFLKTFEDGKRRYAGSVGTGWNAKTGQQKALVADGVHHRIGQWMLACLLKRRGNAQDILA